MHEELSQIVPGQPLPHDPQLRLSTRVSTHFASQQVSFRRQREHGSPPVMLPSLASLAYLPPPPRVVPPAPPPPAAPDAPSPGPPDVPPKAPPPLD
jgi:hypothetical protein